MISKILEKIVTIGIVASFTLPLWKPISTKFKEPSKPWTYIVSVIGPYAFLAVEGKKDEDYIIKPKEDK